MKRYSRTWYHRRVTEVSLLFYSRIYLVLSLIYWGIAILTHRTLMGGDSQLSLTFIATASAIFSFRNIALLGLICVISFRLSRKRPSSDTVLSVFYIMLAQIPFFAGFHTIKLLVPLPAGFWADELLAKIDFWLHGGQHAWIAYDKMLGWFIPDTVIMISYFPLWGAVAYMFPVFIAAFENDDKTIIRYIFLYVLTWLILGNFFAIIAASSGPVYFYNVTGRNDFFFLKEFLQANNDILLALTELQEQLWLQHQKGDLGTGVSAFPSLHVAISMLPVIYGFEKLGIKALPIAVAPIMIQYGAVRTGFHYALDGYFSIIAILLVNICLRANKSFTGSH